MNLKELDILILLYGDQKTISQIAWILGVKCVDGVYQLDWDGRIGEYEGY